MRAGPSGGAGGAVRPLREILAANLHPLKDLLPKQDLLAVAERVCMTATNQVPLPRKPCLTQAAVIMCDQD